MNLLGLAKHGLNSFEQIAILAVLLTAFLSLAYAWILRGVVLKKDKGTAKMQEVWNAIRIGADSYLTQQLKRILPVIGVLTIVLFLSVYVVKPSQEAVNEFGSNAVLIVAIGRTLAFIMGAMFSLLVGQLGMRMAIQANVRAASAARRSFNEALSISYYAGTVTGMLTDGLGLFGGTIIFIVFGTAAPDALLGFGFGGTLLAMFMRVGGGIFTKAADVGADLVGKVEKDIPEDDPRNAAVIADLVGDNVGDCAGMAADIFESYEVTIVSGLMLGLALMAVDPTHSLKWIVFPLIIRAIGVISSILGTFTVPIWVKFPIKFLRAHDAEEAMFRSYEVSSINTIVLSFVLAIFYAGDWRLAMLTSIGVASGRRIQPADLVLHLDQAQAGEGHRRLDEDGLGDDDPVRPLGRHGVERVGSPGDRRQLHRGARALRRRGQRDVRHVRHRDGRHRHAEPHRQQRGDGLVRPHLGQRQRHRRDGVARHGGRGDEEGAPDHGRPRRRREHDQGDHQGRGHRFGRHRCDHAVRHVLHRHWSRAATAWHAEVLEAIRISDVRVFIGFLLGGALPWLFSSLCIKAVSRAASLIVEEVRRQFRIPGLMEGKVKPDYARAVGISTAAAQKELIPLAIISVLLPIAIGLILQVEALGGFLAGVILSGQLLAVYMANAGGAWDNAKKPIEDEPRDLAANTGKGSERHKASVVGDTVGDPLKDTAGPALNPMIKVVNMVSLLAAPILVTYSKMNVWTIVLVVVFLVAVAASIWWSKKPARPFVDKPGKKAAKA